MKHWRFAAVLLTMSASLHAQGTAAQAASSALTPSAPAAAAVERKNWYNDPFFTLSQAAADCPVPLGPLMTKAQMEDDAHYRVERGTTCWLAHRCTKPNSYMYDPEIAEAIRAQFAQPKGFDGASIWITVQRRFVYAEGCAPASFDVGALQKRLAAIPDVEQVFMRVTASPRGPLPYKTLAAPD
jgi:hypothetical protein